MISAHRKHNRERYAAAMHAAFIASPAIGSFTVRCPAQFALHAPAGHAGDNTAITAGDRNIGVPALVAGQVHRIGQLEQGVAVTFTSLGLELMIHTGLGVYKKVAG